MGEARARARAGTCASGPRLRSALFSSKSPYLSSPSTGCLRCARCTRIWCVRPVRSSASSRLNSRARARCGGTRSRPPARRPTRDTRLSPSRVDASSRSARRTRCISLRKRPATADEVALVHRRARACISCSAVSAERFLATSSTPEVSRSRRCTSSRKRASGRIAAQRFDHAVGDAAAAVHREARGLVDREEAHRPRRGSAAGSAAPGRRRRARPRAPGECGCGRPPPRFWRRLDALAVDRAPRRCAGSGRRGSSARPSGARCRKLSMRWPASSSATSIQRTAGARRGIVFAFGRHAAYTICG